MMVNTNIDWVSKTDRAIVESIGNYIKQNRLNQNKTQLQIAKEAGVNRWTISQIENGAPITLLLLIQILRALDLLDALNGFKLTKQISPIVAAKLEQKKRKRARNKSDNNQNSSEW